MEPTACSAIGRDTVTRLILTGTLMLTLPILAGVPSAAAAAGISAADAYRLSLEKPDAFRLGITPSRPPGSAPVEDQNKASQLSDRPYAALIQSAALDAGLNPALVHAVIFVESRYNPRARSVKGAIGLMQVLPETAARYGVADPGHSPEANLRAGTRYLQDLMGMFDGRLELVLAAYNAGERAVIRFGQRVPPFPETMAYVPAVLAKFREWEEKPEPRPVPALRRIIYLPGTVLNPR
jgi:soluble lytic murein transglycosylase-like protein